MKKYEGLYHYKDCGLDNIYLQGGVFVTEFEGESCFSIANLKGLHAAIAHDLVNKKGHLTGKEFRFLRIEIGLSQKAVASLFGCTELTIANYEKADKKNKTLPPLADAAIRKLYKDGSSADMGELLEMIAKTTERTNKQNVFKFKPRKQEWDEAKDAA